jgi:ABC-type transport system substrate-binding protein
MRAQTGYGGWAADYPSAVSFITPQFGCAAFVPASPQLSSDPSEFCDRAIDAQMDRATALQAQDPPAATLLWQRIEREILAQAPVLPTYNPRNVDFVSAHWQLPIQPAVGRPADQLLINRQRQRVEGVASLAAHRGPWVQGTAPAPLPGRCHRSAPR